MESSQNDDLVIRNYRITSTQSGARVCITGYWEDHSRIQTQGVLTEDGSRLITLDATYRLEGAYRAATES